MFSNVALSAVAFLLALGILISIHEWGHFWVARRVGIKVLRYSIGFGRPLITHRGKMDNTEFVLAAIPLGGYVKMLDEREGPVPTADAHRAFNRQPLWARSAVVVAGPLANFILAFVAYWLVLVIGISGVAPLLGPVTADTAAARAGFEFEDRIVAVEGQQTQSWADARIALLDASLDAEAPLAIDVETMAGERLTRQLDIDAASMLKSDGDAVANLGFTLWWPQVDPVVGEVVEGSVAQNAGLMAGDVVQTVDGEPIATWRDFVMAVQPRAGEELTLELLRNGAPLSIALIPEIIEQGDVIIGRIGVIETQSAAFADRARVTVSYPPLDAIGRALERTWDMSILTVRMLGKLVTGQASLDNISGPISIAQFAGQSATIGIDHYINFIALISISLAVLNLLPIPMLDGGHLLYFACEAVTRKPVPEQVQIYGQQLGIVLLGCLMFVAFYNDIWRLLQ